MATTDDAGVIDITNMVSNMQSTFISMAEAYVLAAILAVPGLGWLMAPILKYLLGGALTWIITKIATWSVMQAFFLNTAIRKASQAQDYTDAVAAKNSLPKDVSDADYEKAEQTEMAAFRDFVILSN